MGPQNIIESNGIYFFSTKGNENNKQIDSSESTKNTNFDAQNNGLPINDLPF
jgi:single-strand DNA-binding protein